MRVVIVSGHHLMCLYNDLKEELPPISCSLHPVDRGPFAHTQVVITQMSMIAIVVAARSEATAKILVDDK